MAQIQAKDLSGSMVALVTPMHANGKINFQQWQQIIDWHLQAGTDALVVGGTTGESALLTEAELSELTVKAVAACQGSATQVIVGTGTIQPEKVIAANLKAHELGADAALVVTPYYLTLTQNALITHFTHIAKQSPIPIILYNVPSRTGIDLSAKSTKQLAQIENIIGIKEAKSDMQRIQKLLKIDQFSVLSGDDHSFVTAMSLGAHGVISVAANVIPKSIKQLTTLLQLGNIAEAETRNQELNSLYDFLFHEPNPCPLKAMMAAAGIIDSGIRAPLQLTQLKTSEMKKHLKTIKQELKTV